MTFDQYGVVCVTCSSTDSCRMNHNDAMIKTQWKRRTQWQWRSDNDNAGSDKDAGRLLYKYLPLTLLQGFERVVQGLRVRGSWRSNITAIFWPQTYGRHFVSFLFSWCSTGSPEATLLGDDFLSGILSASSPDLNSSGPKGPFGLMWLSLPHFASNCLELELNWQVELTCVI